MRPLEGVRVLDLGQIYSGPYCTLLLAYLGAEVVKIEPIGGEHTRERTSGGESYAYMMLGSNKKAICLNLKSDEGREVFLDLARHADIVVENFALGTMDRLGLGYEALSAVNPKLIVASIKGFNSEGPERETLAMDLTVQAMTGIMSVTGFPENPPVKAGVALADIIGGVTTALGILAAVVERSSTGRGKFVEVAMQDALIPTLASNIAAYFESGGSRPERTGNRHGGLAVAPYNVYRCSDGWIAVLCARDRHWNSLLQAIDRTDLLEDERFGSVSLRAQNIDLVDETVEAWTSLHEMEAAVKHLQASDVPCSPVRTLAELVADPFHRSGGVLPEIEHPTMGSVRVFGNPIRLSDSVSEPEKRPVEPAPLLGQHTDDVLADWLSLDPAALAALRASGAIG